MDKKCDCGAIIKEKIHTWSDGTTTDITPSICVRCQNKKSDREYAQSITSAASIRLQHSNIPPEYRSYDPKLGNSELVTVIRQNRHKFLWIEGDFRVGKTRSMCLVGKELLQNERVIYQHASIAEEEYKEAVKTATVKKYINKIMNHELIIFDDIGKGGTISAHAGRLMYLLLDLTIANQKRIWFSANKGLKAICAGFNSTDQAGAFAGRFASLFQIGAVEAISCQPETPGKACTGPWVVETAHRETTQYQD